LALKLLRCQTVQRRLIMGKYKLALFSLGCFALFFNGQPVPEPGTLVLLGLGAAAVAIARKLR
jgi:hypothetical protein